MDDERRATVLITLGAWIEVPAPGLGRVNAGRRRAHRGGSRHPPRGRPPAWDVRSAHRLGALAHRLLGDLGSRLDHDPIDNIAGNRTQVRDSTDRSISWALRLIAKTA